MRIKVIPCKSETLCEKCELEARCLRGMIKDGEPCKYFKRALPTMRISDKYIAMFDANGNIVFKYDENEKT